MRASGRRADALGGDLVADEAEGACTRERPQVCQLLGLDEAHDRLVERNVGGNEDSQYHGETREPLSAEGAQKEGDPHRECCQRIAKVVNEVGQECDRPREGKDGDLCAGSQAEDGKALADRCNTGSGTDDRPIEKPVGVALVVPVKRSMRVALCCDRLPRHDALGIGSAKPSLRCSTWKTAWSSRSATCESCRA